MPAGDETPDPDNGEHEKGYTRDVPRNVFTRNITTLGFANTAVAHTALLRLIFSALKFAQAPGGDARFIIFAVAEGI